MGSRTGSITFGGLASGFPTNEIIEQIVELERRPIELLEGQKETFEEKLEIFQDLNTKTRDFRDKLRDLDNMTNVFNSESPSADEEFGRFTAGSGDETIATATASADALPGNVIVRVTALAAAEREVSQGYTNLTDTVGTGNFRITVGSTETDITISSSNNTIEQFVAAINDSGADVRAYIINDGSATPYRIGIEGKTSGSTNTIDVSTGTTLTGGTADPSFTETQSAASATLLLDPGTNQITITSTSNTFTDVVEGLTIEARKVSSSDVTIAVEEDVDAMISAISGLVTTYNDIVDIINEQSTVDPNTNRGGVLIGDSTLVSLKRQLSSIIASQIGSGNIQSSATIGIELDEKGKLSLDEDDLRTQLESSFNDVKTFFAGEDGFADQLRSVSDIFTDPVSGALITRIDGTNDSIDDLEDSIEDAEERLENTEADLVRRFAALERIISRQQQQAAFIASFLQTINR